MQEDALEPMPVTAVAMIAAAVLHALTAALVSIDLPTYVPIAFDLDREPVAAAPTGVLLLVVAGGPLLLAAAVAVAAARVRRPLSGDRLRHLAAVTLLFLTFEVAAVYGTLGGLATASWTVDDVAYGSASIAVEGFQRAGGRLPTTALVVAAVYLAYLVTWALAVRRSRRVGVDQPS